MNSTKRVIDASRGLPPNRNTQAQYPARHIVRQPYTITVQPNANMIYKEEPKPNTPTPTPVAEEKAPVKDVQLDTGMRGFDISGNNINEIYNKNADRIKIVPE